MNQSKSRLAYLLILPVVLYVMAFIVYPVFNVIQMSFTDRLLTDPSSGNFVGLASYRKIFTDPVTLTALKNTCVYVLGGVALTMLFGILVGQVLSLFDTVHEHHHRFDPDPLGTSSRDHRIGVEVDVASANGYHQRHFDEVPLDRQGHSFSFRPEEGFVCIGRGPCLAFVSISRNHGFRCDKGDSAREV